MVNEEVELGKDGGDVCRHKSTPYVWSQFSPAIDGNPSRGFSPCVGAMVNECTVNVFRCFFFCFFFCCQDLSHLLSHLCVRCRGFVNMDMPTCFVSPSVFCVLQAHGNNYCIADPPPPFLNPVCVINKGHICARCIEWKPTCIARGGRMSW